MVSKRRVMVWILLARIVSALTARAKSKRVKIRKSVLNCFPDGLMRFAALTFIGIDLDGAHFNYLGELSERFSVIIRSLS